MIWDRRRLGHIRGVLDGPRRLVELPVRFHFDFLSIIIYFSIAVNHYAGTDGNTAYDLAPHIASAKTDEFVVVWRSRYVNRFINRS